MRAILLALLLTNHATPHFTDSTTDSTPPADWCVTARDDNSLRTTKFTVRSTRARIRESVEALGLRVLTIKPGRCQ